MDYYSIYIMDIVDNEVKENSVLFGICILLLLVGLIPTGEEYLIMESTTIENNITYYQNTTNNVTSNNYYNVSNSSVQCSGTDKLSNVSIVNGLITGVCTTDQTGGGSSGGITIFDLITNPYYFSRYDFESVTAGYTERYVPTAITVGTSAVTVGLPNHPGLVTISNGVPANSGYSYQFANADAYVLDNDYFTTLSVNISVNAVQQNASAPINGSQGKFGFIDIFTVADPVDGCFFNFSQNNLSYRYVYGVCKNNSIASRTVTNYTLLNNTFYTFMVYVHNKSNLVKFYVFNESDVLEWSDNVSSRISIVPARATSSGVNFWRSGNSSARVQATLDFISVGVNRTVNR